MATGGDFLSTCRDAKWAWHIAKLQIAKIIFAKFHLRIDSQNIFGAKISRYTVSCCRKVMVKKVLYLEQLQDKHSEEMQNSCR